MDHLAFEFEFWEARDAKARQLQWWLTKKAAQGNRGSLAPQTCRFWLAGMCRLPEHLCPYQHVYHADRIPTCWEWAHAGRCGDPGCMLQHAVKFGGRTRNRRRARPPPAP